MAEVNNSSANSEQVTLPPSVELLIDRICNEQRQPPLRSDSRQILASLGEQEALNLLRKISAEQIRVSFDGFISCLARKLIDKAQNSSPASSSSSSSFYSPNKRHCLPMSPQQQQNSSLIPMSPPQQQNRSPITPTRLMMTPPSANSNPITPTRLMTTPPTPSANLTPFTPTRLMMDSPSDFGVQFPNAMRQELRGLSMRPNTASGSTISPQLVALVELEFRKAFLILSYVGGKSLEEVLSADQVRGFKDLTMGVFEQEIWDAFGCECGYIKHEDRLKHWDSEKTHIYVCHVYPDGSYRFKGPNLTTTQNLLQRTLGDDNILMVKFEEEVTDERGPAMNSGYHYSLKYRRILKEGILVGLRRYRFFVFKAGGKKKDPTTSPVKCFFIHMDSDATVDNQDYVLCGKTVRQARALFMHVDNLTSLSNYMSRFSLILSKTLNVEVDLSSVVIETIPDEQCKDDGNVVYNKDGEPRIHTDGTGFISPDLTLKCPKNVFKGKCKNASSVERLFKERDLESHHGEPPLLIQIRLFENGRAIKGTLLVNKKLPRQTIRVRPSMIKVDKDPKLLNNLTINSLEVCGTSNKPKKAHLSKNLIALLSYGGVPAEFFMGLLDDALDNSCRVLSDPLAALRVALKYGKMDDNFVTEMILSGIPLGESYLQYLLSLWMKEEKKSLKGGKIPVPESYYLMGTVDPTERLERDEVCVILDNGPVSGKVLVYRNPGSHFGDVHILKATYVDSLHDFVGYAKYAIFFPCKGPRSLADEMGGGDFDGDMFFVSMNRQLLDTFKQSEPCPPSSMHNVPRKKKSPGALSDEKLEEELFELFFSTRFKPSYTVSEAATSWLATMDQLLTLGDDCIEEKARLKNNILQLIDIYYDALDVPKKGGAEIRVPSKLKAKKFPHYMKKKEEISYVSSSILGIIYDKVKSFEEMNRSTIEVKIHHCFEAKVRESCLEKWKLLYKQYRMEMRDALEHNNKETKDEAADEVIKRYKEELYGAAEFNMSKRSEEDIFEEALSIYQLSYEHAKERGIGKCSFAWRVAGSALCEFYSKSQGEPSRIPCSPSALKAIVQFRK